MSCHKAIVMTTVRASVILLHMCYAHLIFVRSEQFVNRGSFMTTYVYKLDKKNERGNSIHN